MIPPRWAGIDLLNTDTATGVQHLLTTDTPCHLWCRWTMAEPRIHSKAILTRGLRTRDDVRFCFTVFFDIEQDEAGDTYSHTFQNTPWFVGVTRYFYFHGQVAGVTSPSTTAIFQWTRGLPPVTTTFYPDAHPEVSSCDGHVAKDTLGPSWSQSRDGAGDWHDDSQDNMFVSLRTSGAPAGRYYYFHRVIVTLDLSSIIGAAVNSAQFRIRGNYKTNNYGVNGALNLFRSDPTSMNDLINSDYSTNYTAPFATHILYAAYNSGGWNTFTLNATGLSYLQSRLNGDGKVKFMLRESNFDAPNNEPFSGKTNARLSFWMWSREKGLSYSPHLILTYMP